MGSLGDVVGDRVERQVLQRHHGRGKVPAKEPSFLIDGGGGGGIKSRSREGIVVRPVEGLMRMLLGMLMQCHDDDDLVDDDVA